MTLQVKQFCDLPSKATYKKYVCKLLGGIAKGDSPLRFLV